MCLLLIANKFHSDYKIIIAANRDEFYDRQSFKASFWEDQPELLAGKDLEAGGTWLGITKSGKFSAITNYRNFHNPVKQNAPTRGKLTTDFLLGNDSSEIYSEKLQKKSSNYNGFNLIYGFIDELYYFSNETNFVVKLEAGLYGLSNALLNTPWPKVTESKKRMAELISSKKIDIERLFEMLLDTKTAEDELLPDTGIGLEKERVLSSNFIKSSQYGTRCSSVILIDNQNRVNFFERTFNQTSEKFSEVNYKFQIGK